MSGKHSYGAYHFKLNSFAREAGEVCTDILEAFHCSLGLRERQPTI